MATKLKLSIRRGASPEIPIRVESDVLSYVAITSMSKSAPLRIGATGHGILDGWPVAVMGAGGMTNLNAPWDEIDKGRLDRYLRRSTLVDADNIDINQVNSSGFSTYTSGGQLVFYTPLDLSSFVSARMDVKTSIGGAIIATFNTSDGTLAIDSADSTIWFKPAIVTPIVIPARDYYFDIELVRADDSVLALCAAESVLTVLPEATTST
mgnify:CR=1 FL=1